MDRANHLPSHIPPTGNWRSVFNYHPFDVELERADGIYLYDSQGRQYIDASGGPMAVNIGHGDHRLKQAVSTQMDRFAFAHPFLANRARADYCARLCDKAPDGLNAAFLVSGGSEAVETAIKLARQYHVVDGKPDKHKFISYYESYHGMSVATMALSGSAALNRVFDPIMPKWPHMAQYSDVTRPAHIIRDDWGIECASALEKILHYENPETVAAFIATPIGCGSDYGVVPPRSYWQEIRRICDDYNVLLILDEVVTGFGRTGKMFACEHFDIVPDIMTVAKGMSGCAVPLGGILISDKVASPFYEDAYFAHGFTNQGHPLACAAGNTVLEILEQDRLIEKTAELGEHLFSFKEKLLNRKTIADVRGIGLLMVLELVEDKGTRSYFAPECNAEHLFQAHALNNGLVFYSTLYGPRRRPLFRRGLPMWICPPLCITSEQIDELMTKLEYTLDDWEAALNA